MSLEDRIYYQEGILPAFLWLWHSLSMLDSGIIAIFEPELNTQVAEEKKTGKKNYYQQNDDKCIHSIKLVAFNELCN
ncbi:MAG: hypothetical protein R3B93_27860 [Bacteroidia bacterium]